MCRLPLLPVFMIAIAVTVNLLGLGHLFSIMLVAGCWFRALPRYCLPWPFLMSALLDLYFMICSIFKLPFALLALDSILFGRKSHGQLHQRSICSLRILDGAEAAQAVTFIQHTTFASFALM